MKTTLSWLFCGAMFLSACASAQQSSPPSTDLSSGIQPTGQITIKFEATSTPSPAPTDDPLPEPQFSPTANTARAEAAPISTPGTSLSQTNPAGQQITIWHVWGKGAAYQTMSKIVNDFNAQNEWDIEVLAVEAEGYADLEHDLYAAVASGATPNLIVAYANVLAKLWSEGQIADLNAYFMDDQFGFTEEEISDFYGAPLDAGSINGTRVGFPFSQSANVIFYNRTWAQELGFQRPPADADEFKLQACTASQANKNDTNPNNNGTGGFVLYPGTANILSWIYSFGGDLIYVGTNNYSFNSRPFHEVAIFLRDLIDQGCAFQTESYPNPEFATRKALFTTSSSVGCQYQIRAFEEKGAYNDEWQLLAFPGHSGNQAIVIFPQMIGMIDKTPEQNLAAWLFMKHLASPAIQAEWALGSQYYPVRKSSLELNTDYATDNPQWASGLDLLTYGRSEPTRSSWGLVRRYVQDTFTVLIESGSSDLQTLLTDLDSAAVEAIAEIEK